jgi:hypothetical protein
VIILKLQREEEKDDLKRDSEALREFNENNKGIIKIVKWIDKCEENEE